MDIKAVKITATRTNDLDLSAATREEFSLAELVDYLQQSPRHALVIHGVALPAPLKLGSAGRPFTPVYVLRGASEALDNFYFGEFPAEDPNDAEGGDLTAEKAIAAAVTLLIGS